MKKTHNRRILIVEDETSFALSLIEGLKLYFPDIEIVTAENGFQGLASLAESRPDLLITDLKMPVMDGFELIEKTNLLYPDLPVIVVSAHESPLVEMKLRELGVQTFLEKPLELEDLAEIISGKLKSALDEEGFNFEAALKTVDTYFRSLSSEY